MKGAGFACCSFSEGRAQSAERRAKNVETGYICASDKIPSREGLGVG